MELRDILLEKNCSIIASNGYFSYDSGIRPVIDRINEKKDFFKDLEVADKIIGKASAMLLTLSGVRKVHAIILSEAGKDIFEKYGVEYSFDELTDYIVNRRGDGMCPMEMTVKDIDSLEEAYEALKKKTALL